MLLLPTLLMSSKRIDFKKQQEKFQYMKVAYKKAGETLFTQACSDSTKGNGFNLTKRIFGLDIGKKLFIMRVLRHWNRLLSVQGQLDGALSNPVDSLILCFYEIQLEKEHIFCLSLSKMIKSLVNFCLCLFQLLFTEKELI